jgi:hypothetical protein
VADCDGVGLGDVELPEVPHAVYSRLPASLRRALLHSDYHPLVVNPEEAGAVDAGFIHASPPRPYASPAVQGAVPYGRGMNGSARSGSGGMDMRMAGWRTGGLPPLPPRTRSIGLLGVGVALRAAAPRPLPQVRTCGWAWVMAHYNDNYRPCLHVPHAHDVVMELHACMHAVRPAN